ncbi:MAG: class I SAM-dependent methyltransferase [Aphanothece sp. CMT-3BRIN-NPC111]|jgi:ubiquinone/menaquinone biosynthesis C-methylase UbiE|nr:class I SAM-dependent methyltransferase [Aphanothece sp. CMT-3BRIN-NPC111]
MLPYSKLFLRLKYLFLASKTKVFRLYEDNARDTLRNFYELGEYNINVALGRQDPLIPPKHKCFVGDGDFKAIGEIFFQIFLELGALKPGEKVLDVGCGIGRMARPLTNYLKDGGSYEGIDIVADGIKWCQKKITPTYPNCKFQLIDVYNKEYNPTGKYKASEYKFPYDNNSFDFIFLTSVFTHMLPQDMENYFSEIARTLKQDGRCLITFFLLNNESLDLINKNLSPLLQFQYEMDGCRTADKDIPERAIAFDEKYVRSIYGKYGVNIVEPIRYGSWCGRENFLSYQDIILAIKT